MLLRHTPVEGKEREALTINPAKTCQPIGAMYASLGVHGCLPHSHGSQGCCAYHRSALTRHYKEPIMAGTSSFTEGSSVFGGQANLLQAIDNIFTVYDPDIIAVHTTCLSETIGDDVPQITSKALDDGKIPEGKKVIYTNTPSYVGSHVTGFSNMVKSIVEQLGGSTGTAKQQLNVLPGWVEPGDMREMKRILSVMGADSVVCPDTSGVVDAPMTGKFTMYPDGGTTQEELAGIGDSVATLACGFFGSSAAASAIDSRFKVPYRLLDLPIGLAATDRFVAAVAETMGVCVPASLEFERGRLIDLITDMQQYFYGKRAALWGDPDQLVSLAEFCLSVGMQPVYVVTGTPGKAFMKRMEELYKYEYEVDFDYRIKQPGDMFEMHQWIKEEPVDLLIGNTYGKYIARDENIPYVRHGFPIYDRIGHQYFPTVGYAGAMRLCEKILDVFLDKKDRESPEESFELVL